MNQKVITVGNSLGITLPIEFVKRTGLSAGNSVTTTIKEDTGILQVETKTKTFNKLLQSKLSPEFVNRVDSFIKRHKPALEKLAKL